MSLDPSPSSKPTLSRLDQVSDSGQDSRRREAVQETGILDQPAPSEFHEMCRRAQAQFKVASALVKVLDEDSFAVMAEVGIDIKSVPRHEAFSDHTIRSDEVFVVPDTTKDGRFAPLPLVKEHSIRFYAGAPLVYLRKVRLGSLCLFDVRPREFSLGDQAELTNMAEELVHLLTQRDMDRISRLLDR